MNRFALLALAVLVLACSKKEETKETPTATATVAPSASAETPPIELPDAMAFLPDAAGLAQPIAKSDNGGLTEADYEEAAINEINEKNLNLELAKIEYEISK